MATIYRFIVENRDGGGASGGRRSSTGSKKTTGKGKWESVLTGPKGGVEHNRKMRAINPLLNKITGGYWEKGMRLTRAMGGLVQRNTETGKLRIGGPSIAIIIALIINEFLKLQNKNLEWGAKRNTQNYKSMENGVSQVHGEYQVSVNTMSGRISYNENK